MVANRDIFCSVSGREGHRFDPLAFNENALLRLGLNVWISEQTASVLFSSISIALIGSPDSGSARVFHGCARISGDLALAPFLSQFGYLSYERTDGSNPTPSSGESGELPTRVG